MAVLNFDARDVKPSEGFEAVPAGDYLATITDSEMKATRAGTGHYLQLTFSIAEGAQKGRKVWARLNIDNPNSVAVEIARGELSAICHAVGVMKLDDSVQLHNLPLLIKVVCKPRDNGDISNEIKSYKPRSAATPAAPASMPGAGAEDTGKAPWEV